MTPNRILARRLIEQRCKESSLSIGEYMPPGDLLSYRRQFDRAKRWFIILSLGTEQATLPAPASHMGGELRFSRA
jgi:hypothetical protein